MVHELERWERKLGRPGQLFQGRERELIGQGQEPPKGGNGDPIKRGRKRELDRRKLEGQEPDKRKSQRREWELEGRKRELDGQKLVERERKGTQ